MRIQDEEKLKEDLCGRRLDFYLEDDMFEVEGAASLEDGKIIVRVTSAVGHMLRISGEYLELQVNDKRLYAQRRDTGKIFDMEINRIYENLKDPSAEDFLRMNDNGVDQFFRKPTDTLVWFDKEQDNWTIEFNKINMFFSGDRSTYDKIGQLVEAHKNEMSGIWQAIYFSSSVEEGN